MLPISKLPKVGTTIFTVMSKMANTHGAINLSQGFPDFEVSGELIDLVSDYMKRGNNQYAPMAGLPQLRASIAGMVQQSSGQSPDADKEITITAGATEAIYATLTALVKTGDEVILFDPSYDCYDPAIQLNGGVPVHLKLTQPNFSIDWDLVKSSIHAKTKLIIINSPHNPSGAVLSAEDLKTLEDIVLDHDLIVISDEVYEHIIFDDVSHQSILKSPILRQRGVAVFSFGKTFHATGWKVGYTIAPEEITNEIRKIHQYLTFSVNTPVQYALADYCSAPANYQELGDFYQKKRDFFLDKMKASRFKSIKSLGTYFQLFSYHEISELGDFEMAKKLTEDHGVAAIPISAFYKDNHDDRILRFCFAKNEATLEKASEILCKI